MYTDFSATTFGVIAGSVVVLAYIIFVCFVNRQAGRFLELLNIPVEKIHSGTFISVVIAFRNEASHLPALINSLQQQDYPETGLEVILVNDHSTDQWESVIGHLPENIRVINSKGEGKKAAIATGIDMAKGKLIACTDADCVLPSGWLSAIATSVETSHAGLLIGFVKVAKSKGLLNLFEQFEFQSLQLSGLGCALMNRPIMCNGANLVFEKELYVQNQMRLSHQYLSGDDMFLLHAVKRQGKAIGVIESRQAIVSTQSARSFRQFINQRIRWASKSTGYRDKDTIVVALMVFGSSLAFILIGIAAFFSAYGWMLFAGLFWCKGLTERLLFRKGAQIFETPWKEAGFWISSIIHPFYVIIIALVSMFTNVKWKGRRVIK